MLHIGKVGIRNGEKITSSPKSVQNSGTVIEIRGKTELVYPPTEGWVVNITDLEIRNNMGVYTFFENMSYNERLKWLNDNKVNLYESYLEDVEMEIKFIKIGGKFFLDKLGDDGISKLMEDSKWWPIREVYNMFPKNPGSKSKKHTLIFRPSNWVLMPDEKMDKKYMPINIDNGKFGDINKFKKSVELSNSKIEGVTICYGEKRIKKLKWSDMLNLAGECGGNKNSMEKIKEYIEWMTPSVHKSLIQKIIRTKCIKVEHEGIYYNPVDVLYTSISLLMLCPGSFVPNIQKYVTGLESMKRIAVSIMEDSWTDKIEILLSIYCMSLLSQHDKMWEPSDNQIKNIFNIARESQQTEKLFDYNNKKCEDDYEINSYYLCYEILKELKSFDSDINMLKSIAKNKGCYRKIINKNHLETMPLIHCIDHHCYPEIAHKIQYNGKQYSEIFGDIWDKCSGVNPRSIKYLNWNSDIEYIRKAQKYIWNKKSRDPVNIDSKQKGVYNVNYNLSDQLLAGYIGHILTKVGKTDCIVVVLPSDVKSCKLVAIKHPSRNTEIELTEYQKTEAIKSAISILRNGVTINCAGSFIPGLNKSTVYYKGDIMDDLNQPYFCIKTKDGSETWENYCNMNLSFPLIESYGITIEDAILKTSDGVVEDADYKLKTLISEYDTFVLSRLKHYIVGYTDKIVLGQIGRDGNGTDYSVLPIDTLVDNILCYICCLYPSALRSSTNGYIVKNGPLFWHVRNLIFDNCLHTEKFTKWPKLKKVNVHLWEHQTDSVNSMIKKSSAGNKGHEIWINVGMGKTAIAIEYIRYLISNNKMPKYCVWTGPPSSIDNIIKEFQRYRMDAIQVGCRSSESELEPYKINIVQHDHMRKLHHKLKLAAPNTLFIVDEFHKTMAKTIRTSVALELVKLSYDFVAMSGTIIKGTGSDMKELFVWLQQIVNFEVTDKNYIVAISELISKKITTNVYVDRINISADIKNPNKYYASVPLVMGGTASNIDFKTALECSYDSTMDELVYYILEYVGVGEKVFVAVKDTKRQNYLYNRIKDKVSKVYLITNKTPITLKPEDNSDISVIITTKQHVEGYTLTDRRVALYELFFANQSIYEQLDGRLNRIGQPSDEIRIITIHSGVLSYIYKKYNAARNLSETLKGFAKEIDMDVKSIISSM